MGRALPRPGNSLADTPSPISDLVKYHALLVAHSYTHRRDRSEYTQCEAARTHLVAVNNIRMADNPWLVYLLIVLWCHIVPSCGDRLLGGAPRCGVVAAVALKCVNG
jgi:hypothetical protein